MVLSSRWIKVFLLKAEYPSLRVYLSNTRFKHKQVLYNCAVQYTGHYDYSYLNHLEIQFLGHTDHI